MPDKYIIYIFKYIILNILNICYLAYLYLAFLEDRVKIFHNVEVKRDSSIKFTL